MSSGNKAPQTVRLNVYDLIEGQGQGLLHTLGVGLYHSGVEVNDSEWSFGACESGTGVFQTTPRVALGTSVYRETIDMGVTTLSRVEINELIGELSAAYAGRSYDITSKNCNTFTNALCLRLTGQPIPAWVNRAASIGATVNSIVPLSSLGLLPPSRTDSSAASAAAPATATAAAPFSGTGHVLSDSGGSAAASASATAVPASATANTTASSTADEQRLRRLAAIEKRLATAPTSP